MPNSIEFYLSKGYDRAAAEYFASGRKRLTAAQANPDFTLTLTYNSTERRLYDMRPILASEGVFSVLRNWEDFRRVYVDDTHSVAWDIDPTIDSKVEWSNLLDLCPDSCYLNSTPIK